MPSGERWRIGGSTVTGASHVRAKRGNQDAIKWAPEGKDAVASGVVAVADGHGSNRFPRSAIGAELATHVATDVVTDLLKNTTSAAELAKAAVECVPRNIVRAWRTAVRDHCARHPFGESEISVVGQLRVLDAPWFAYGSTLVVAAITPALMLLWQLGDGDAVGVCGGGEASWTIEPEQDIAEETRSLCLESATHDFRTRILERSNRSPELVFIATDGYRKSFTEAKGFLQAGTDLLTTIRAEGADSVFEQLPSWLDETSRTGSGDDISVGLLVRAR